MVAALCRCVLQCTRLRAAKAIVATAPVSSVLTVMIQMSCFVRLSIVAPDPSAMFNRSAARKFRFYVGSALSKLGFLL